MYKCIYCNKEFKTSIGLYIHIKKIHNIVMNFDERYKFINYICENKEIPKCKYCDNEIYVKNKRGSIICDNIECKHKYLSDIQKEIHKNNPQLAVNARKRRIEYLSNPNNFYKTAYGIRANKNMSYLEKWFFDNIIAKYKLYDKYLIINEYKITNDNFTSAYSLDFAFMNIKLDVELDGKCHFNRDNERIEHDIIRDNYLLSNGWNIYRISYKDIKENEKDVIEKFLFLLENNEFEYDDNYYIKHKLLNNQDLIIDKNKEKLLKKEQHNSYIKNILIDLENNSNIDFSKFGWVNKAKNYLSDKGFNYKQLHRTIQVYYPEFFTNNNVFVKN